MIDKIEKALSLYPIQLKIEVSNYKWVDSILSKGAKISFLDKNGRNLKSLIDLLIDTAEIIDIGDTKTIYINFLQDTIIIKNHQVINNINQFISDSNIEFSNTSTNTSTDLDINTILVDNHQELETLMNNLVAILQGSYKEYNRKIKISNILSDL